MDDSVELQPGISNDVDIPVETNVDAPSDIASTDPLKNSSDKVYDISEDNIAEVEDTNSAPMQVFPIKRVLPKVPPVQLNKTIVGSPQPNATEIKIPIANTSPIEPPSKNIFDPSYSKSPIQTPTETQPENTLAQNVISKFATEKLPEIPAFKGTFDQKSATFTPNSFIKKSQPTPVSKPESQNTATPIQNTPPTPKPPSFSLSVATTPEPTHSIQPILPTIKAELIKERSIGSIPLKDITIPKNTPANPPAKILGATRIPSTDNKFDLPEHSDIKKLRTYESDVADILAHRNISSASIIIAENARNEQLSQTNPILTDIDAPQGLDQDTKEVDHTDIKHNISKIILIFISVMFIIVGIGGAYYLYSKSVFGPRTSILGIELGPNGSSIITFDTKTTLNISSMDPNTIVAAIKREWEKDQSPNSIHELVITDGQIKVTGPRMVDFMDIDAPDMLKRSLTDPWMLGISTDKTGDKDIFVIATTNFFQNAFAGMFQWESVMADDLKLFLSSGIYRGIVNAPVSTSTIIVNGPKVQVNTAEKTTLDEAVDPYFTLRGQFEDRIIMNKDVRVFRTTQGKVLFFYSFVDNATIVVASKEQTLKEILDRLEKKTFVR